MPDVRRIALMACVLLVALRIAIGWQFLYEGLWKVNAQNSARPWTAKGYLANAQGPFRDYFRNLAGDPDDLDWLDYDKVADRWDRWHQLFVAHYQSEGKPLNAEQKRQLDELINGPEVFTEPLERLPEDYEFPNSLTEETRFWGKQRQIIRYDEQNNQLVLDGKLLLLPNERDALLRSVRVSENASQDEKQAANAFQDAVKNLYKRSTESAKQTYKIRLRAMLKGDPDRAGLVLRDEKGNIDEERMGEIELYRKSLERYEKYLADAEQEFQHMHLKKIQRDNLELKSRLIGPVKALEREMQLQANYQIKGRKTPPLLTDAQIAAGPAPEPTTAIDRVNQFTIVCLIGLGVLLIAGLFTRVAAIAGAGMLLTFYLAMPPWPGVPESPGPDHSLFVNQTLIEVMVLLAIAALPTGTWFGVDGIFRRVRPQTPESPATGPIAESPVSEIPREEDPDDLFKEALERMKSGSGFEPETTASSR